MPNSAALKNNVPIDLCGTVPGSNKISDIISHKKNVQHIQAPIRQTTVKCDDCFEEFSSIAEMIQQVKLIMVSQQANTVCTVEQGSWASRGTKKTWRPSMDSRYDQRLIFVSQKAATKLSSNHNREIKRTAFDFASF